MAKYAAKKEAAADQAAPPEPADNLEQLQDMEVEVSIELGRRRMTLDQALELGQQSVLELDKVVGEPVDIRLNGKLFAQGEVVTVGENFGVKLIEVIGEEQED